MNENTAETLDDLTERVSEHQEATFKTTMRPLDKERIPEILIGTHHRCSDGGFSGQVIVNYNQGGVTNITTLQVQSVPEDATVWPFQVACD